MDPPPGYSLPASISQCSISIQLHPHCHPKDTFVLIMHVLPCAHAQGKAIGLSSSSSCPPCPHKNHQISTSTCLGEWPALSQCQKWRKGDDRVFGSKSLDKDHKCDLPCQSRSTLGHAYRPIYSYATCCFNCVCSNSGIAIDS